MITPSPNIAIADFSSDELDRALSSPDVWNEPESEPKSSKPSPFKNAFDEQLTVIGALVLRDMRTRFGRTHLGFLLAICWPLSHIGFIMLGYLLANRVAPIGNSSAMFVATGVLPYVLFFYPARLMIISALVARPLLHFPIVKFPDLMYARILLEIASAVSVLAIFSAILMMAGVDIMPLHPENVAIGVAVTIFFGIGCGAYNMVICTIFKPWGVISLLGMLGMYATSGAFVLPTLLSTQARYWISYNPLYQSIALLRAGYYDGYYDPNVNPWYIFSLGLIAFIAAFVSERMFRGRILQT